MANNQNTYKRAKTKQKPMVRRITEAECLGNMGMSEAILRLERELLERK